ncbi:MAG TPA: nicotinamide-nucleotide amidase [Sedimenticola sp.]|nr:nicotinamide-nucleotide amidase [Sedimenticola sp.]
METDRDLDAIAMRVGERLFAAGVVLVTAESCTGGWVAKVLTDIPGSSTWFERGFVTYTNEAKQEMLGVREETLEAFGAVSEETVREMAAGALERSHGTLALAISGIAGPGGATPDKPRGTVCFAWAGKGGGVWSCRQHFEGDREAVRRQAVALTLNEVLEYLA